MSHIQLDWVICYQKHEKQFRQLHCQKFAFEFNTEFARQALYSQMKNEIILSSCRRFNVNNMSRFLCKIELVPYESNTLHRIKYFKSKDDSLDRAKAELNDISMQLQNLIVNFMSTYTTSKAAVLHNTQALHQLLGEVCYILSASWFGYTHYVYMHGIVFGYNSSIPETQMIVFIINTFTKTSDEVFLWPAIPKHMFSESNQNVQYSMMTWRHYWGFVGDKHWSVVG